MSIRARILAVLLTLASAAVSPAQTAGDAELNQAYKARAAKDYDSAIELFHKALALQPNNAGAHKDLAYTLVKAGENADARDEFSAALKLNPHDDSAALEFAFLAYETKEPIEARRMFDRLRHSANSATRATAEQAFENIDQPLADGIARWKEALARASKPNDISMFSAHWELAQLAELRDDLPLAAEQYEICRQLKPTLSELLIILPRIWMQLNRTEEARAALLAASRSSVSRTAEQALAQMDKRYPYPYEFVAAIKMDPQNITLRRELAFLYLAMHKDAEAVEQLQAVLNIDPSDRAAREQLAAMHALKKRPDVATAAPAATPASGNDANPIDAKSMGKKSLALGYYNDAIKYLSRAHEQDPNDADVMLKLGFAYNLAKDDKAALSWFDRARHSEDSFVAEEATKAYHNLNGDLPAQTTVWMQPMYSTRWNDFSTYGQVKHSFPLPFLGSFDKWLSFYLSTRFDADTRGAVHTVYGAGYLSEKELISGVGISSKPWHNLFGWVEAGEAVKYFPSAHDFATPNYQGGLVYAKSFGTLLGSKNSGFFYENTGDAKYVSQFDKDWFLISQNRFGRTFHIGSTSAQLLLNATYLYNFKNEYWADYFEMGPGIRIHLRWMPPNVYAMTDLIHGVYTNNLGNPRKPNYNDIRVGFWYAVTK